MKEKFCSEELESYKHDCPDCRCLVKKKCGKPAPFAFMHNYGESSPYFYCEKHVDLELHDLWCHVSRLKKKGKQWGVVYDSGEWLPTILTPRGQVEWEKFYKKLEAEGLTDSDRDPNDEESDAIDKADAIDYKKRMRPLKLKNETL